MGARYFPLAPLTRDADSPPYSILGNMEFHHVWRHIRAARHHARQWGGVGCVAYPDRSALPLPHWAECVAASCAGCGCDMVELSGKLIGLIAPIDPLLSLRALAQSENGGGLITTEPDDFLAVLPSGGRLIGLDVGTKTIGIALCDAGWSIASPAELIHRTKFSKDKAALEALIAAQAVEGIVIGLPLNLDGTDSPRTQSTRSFAVNLKPLSLPILLWDERWSTAAVTRTLIDADTSRARRAVLVDKMAAAYILQGAIDRLLR